MKGIFETLGPEGFGNYECDLSRWPIEMTKDSRAARGFLVPGFVDIHFHGAFGIDFMSASQADLRVMCDKLRARGYESVLPTTVTAPIEAVQRALDALPHDPLIGGFHLEGPFISDQYPGAQPQEYIQNPPMLASEWDSIFADPRLKVITLAPELPGSLELTMKLFQRGVIVSMGHTNATFEEARRGFEFGAAHTTHTFNAMRPFHHREAGTVGYALSNPTLNAELIYDRLHVCTDSARLLLQAKTANRVIAVSDSTMASGLPAGTKLNMWGLEATLGRGDVRLADGTLAGSAITLLEAFQNLSEDFGVETAIRLCSINPRRALKMTESPRKWIEFNSKFELQSIYSPE